MNGVVVPLISVLKREYTQYFIKPEVYVIIVVNVLLGSQSEPPWN